MPWIHGANFLAPKFPFGFRFQRLELSQKERDGGIHSQAFFAFFFHPQEISIEKNASQLELVHYWILVESDRIGL